MIRSTSRALENIHPKALTVDLGISGAHCLYSVYCERPLSVHRLANHQKAPSSSSCARVLGGSPL